MRTLRILTIHSLLPRAVRGVFVAILRARAMQARVERYRARDWPD